MDMLRHIESFRLTPTEPCTVLLQGTRRVLPFSEGAKGLHEDQGTSFVRRLWVVKVGFQALGLGVIIQGLWESPQKTLHERFCEPSQVAKSPGEKQENMLGTLSGSSPK